MRNVFSFWDGSCAKGSLQTWTHMEVSFLAPCPHFPSVIIIIIVIVIIIIFPFLLCAHCITNVGAWFSMQYRWLRLYGYIAIPGNVRLTSFSPYHFWSAQRVPHNKFPIAHTHTLSSSLFLSLSLVPSFSLCLPSSRFFLLLLTFSHAVRQEPKTWLQHVKISAKIKQKTVIKKQHIQLQMQIQIRIQMQLQLHGVHRLDSRFLTPLTKFYIKRIN